MRRLRPPAAAAKCTRRKDATCNAPKRLLKVCEYPPRLRLFWTVTFIVLAGFQGAGAVADYWQIYILTEQTLMPLAVGSPGRPVRLPPLRASPLDGLGGELHAQRSRASLLSRFISAKATAPSRRSRARAHGRLLRSVLPALGDVLRNRRPATRPHLHSLSAAMSVALYSHSPFTARCRSPGCRLRAPLLSTSLPSEEPRRN